jgi:hypothetical protein
MKANQSTTLLFALLTLPIFAQENIIKGAVLGSGGIISGIQFERSITNRLSILATLGFASVYDFFGLEASSGFGLNAEGRYYFSKNKDLMEGWHGGLYFHYLNTDGDNRYEYYHNSLGIGLNGGYQFVFSSNLTLDLYAGGGIKFISSDRSSEDTDFYPMAGLSLGYNF